MQDTVSVAGLTVASQTFALANQTSAIFANSGSDGIMGMGFQSIASSGQPTWFENLVKANTVSWCVEGGETGGSEKNAWELRATYWLSPSAIT